MERKCPVCGKPVVRGVLAGRNLIPGTFGRDEPKSLRGGDQAMFHPDCFRKAGSEWSKIADDVWSKDVAD